MLFSEIDRRNDPLDVKTVGEWEEEGIVYRDIAHPAGMCKSKSARVAAIFGFFQYRKNFSACPILCGGQRASQHEVEFYAKPGRAAA